MRLVKPVALASPRLNAAVAHKCTREVTGAIKEAGGARPAAAWRAPPPSLLHDHQYRLPDLLRSPALIGLTVFFMVILLGYPE
jgi:hypothetical protein